MAGHPQNIVFLTADAFGVLPPLARLTPQQAMYYFLSGYTAKVAGTERGVREPQATFSACFGEPFLPLHPKVYAGMLGEQIRRHRPRVWLLNTGWTAGAYGTGHRIPIPYTRAMVAAVLAGEIDPDASPDRFSVSQSPAPPERPARCCGSARLPTQRVDAQAAKLAAMFGQLERYWAGDGEIRRRAPGKTHGAVARPDPDPSPGSPLDPRARTQLRERMRRRCRPPLRPPASRMCC